MGDAYRVESTALRVPEAAAFRCDDCDKTFSSDAVKRLILRHHESLVCPFCGHGVRKAVEGRIVIAFAPLVLGAFGFAPRELAALAALGIATGLVSYLPFGTWFAAAIVVGYLFAIIRKTSSGGERAPEPADFVDLSDLFAPLGRYLLVIASAVAPAGIAALAGAPAPVTVAASVFGAVYVPGAMIVASEESGLLFNPLAAFAIARRIPGPYALTVGALALAAVVGAGLAVLAGALQNALPMIPFLPRLVAATLALYAPFTAARMLGLLVREHVEDL